MNNNKLFFLFGENWEFNSKTKISTTIISLTQLSTLPISLTIYLLKYLEVTQTFFLKPGDGISRYFGLSSQIHFKHGTHLFSQKTDTPESLREKAHCGNKEQTSEWTRGRRLKLVPISSVFWFTNRLCDSGQVILLHYTLQQFKKKSYKKSTSLESSWELF